MTRTTGLLLGVAALLAAPAALAVDGVVEINAVAAAQGGITPGDTPGLPVTLSRRGSYRLTSDLVTGNLAQLVIEVTAQDVSLDLNGFLVGQCVGATLCGLGNASTIQAFADNFEIRNGLVRGSTSTCVATGSHAVISDLRVADCGTGIAVGFHSRILDVTVTDSEFNGIALGRAGLLRDSVVTGSGSAAVRVSFSGLVLDTIIHDNDGAFASSGGGSFTTAGYRGCLITENDGVNEVQPIGGPLRNLGQNICGSDTICP